MALFVRRLCSNPAAALRAPALAAASRVASLAAGRPALHQPQQQQQWGSRRFMATEVPVGSAELMIPERPNYLEVEQPYEGPAGERRNPEWDLPEPRRYEVSTIFRNVAAAPRKMNDLCRKIRWMSAEEALIQLKFTKNVRAELLAFMIRNAMLAGKHNFGMTPSRLYVASCHAVVNGDIRYELDIKGRSRHGKIRRYHVNVMLTLRQQKWVPGEERVGRSGPSHSHKDRQRAKILLYRSGLKRLTLERKVESLKAKRAAAEALAAAGITPAKVTPRKPSRPAPKVKLPTRQQIASERPPLSAKNAPAAAARAKARLHEAKMKAATQKIREAKKQAAAEAKENQ